ncbi:MAG: hypothetical protein AAF441_18875 [Pseudomonadota bacterium]
MSVLGIAIAGTVWSWFTVPDANVPELGQSRPEAQKALGQFAFFGRTCFGELAVFTDRSSGGEDQHVMAFLDAAGERVVATEIQSEPINVSSAGQCRHLVRIRHQSVGNVREYQSGARVRYFLRTTDQDGALHETWADFGDNGARKSCEVFERRSAAGHNRLTAHGEWLMPASAQTVAFDPFSVTTRKGGPGS